MGGIPLRAAEGDARRLRRDEECGRATRLNFGVIGCGQRGGHSDHAGDHAPTAGGCPFAMSTSRSSARPRKLAPKAATCTDYQECSRIPRSKASSSPRRPTCTRRLCWGAEGRQACLLRDCRWPTRWRTPAPSPRPPSNTPKSISRPASPIAPTPSDSMSGKTSAGGHGQTHHGAGPVA